MAYVIRSKKVALGHNMTGIVAFFLVLILVPAVQSQSVTSVNFSIAAANRVAGSTNAAATFSFVTSATGSLAPGSKITLNYPVGFFTTDGGPAVEISVGSVSGFAGTPTTTTIIITTSSGSIGQSTAVTVTITGLTMGAASAGGSVTVQTSADPTKSAAAASGVIGGAVTSVTFTVFSSDRVAGKAQVDATFAFKTTAGGQLAAGGTITLTFPTGFFSSTGTPGVSISGSGTTGSAAKPTSTRIVITTATQTIAASTTVTVTVTGLTMGSATAGDSNGITIATSADPTESSGVSSGSIQEQVTSNSPSTPSSSSVTSSLLDRMLQDPNFPYYVAGASAHVLNFVSVSVVSFLKGFRPREICKALALALFLSIFSWGFVLPKLKERTGKYCCCSALSCCCVCCSICSCCCTERKKKKEKKDPKQLRADAIMAKHKRDFLARNVYAMKSAGNGVDDDNRFQYASGFMPFGLQQIPDPYGPPLPVMSRHVSVEIHASGADVLNSKKEKKQKLEEGKEKVSKDPVSDVKDKNDKTVQKYKSDNTDEKDKKGKNEEKDKKGKNEEKDKKGKNEEKDKKDQKGNDNYAVA